jgi:hypothetical protein
MSSLRTDLATGLYLQNLQLPSMDMMDIWASVTAADTALITVIWLSWLVKESALTLTALHARSSRHCQYRIYLIGASLVSHLLSELTNPCPPLDPRPSFRALRAYNM